MDLATHNPIGLAAGRLNRVYNTAINKLAGQPPHDYSALWAKYGKRFEPQDMQNLHPIPSGIIGDVHLIEESR